MENPSNIRMNNQNFSTSILYNRLSNIQSEEEIKNEIKYEHNENTNNEIKDINDMTEITEQIENTESQKIT